jgi:hypothetical protein
MSPVKPGGPVESATTPVASPAPTPAAVDQTTASSSPIRQLDRDEINMLVKRGEELVMTRDVATARLMLQRAAEAGDPRAYLVLGATYDPIELEHLPFFKARHQRNTPENLIGSHRSALGSPGRVVGSLYAFVPSIDG